MTTWRLNNLLLAVLLGLSTSLVFSSCGKSEKDEDNFDPNKVENVEEAANAQGFPTRLVGHVFTIDYPATALNLTCNFQSNAYATCHYRSGNDTINGLYGKVTYNPNGGGETKEIFVQSNTFSIRFNLVKDGDRIKADNVLWNNVYIPSENCSFR